jgi:hypothetical protein
MKTHEVLDLVYTPEEGQECYEFIQEQGGASFMYKVVPIVHRKIKLNGKL